MSVRDQNIEMEVEMEFITDMFCVLRVLFMGVRYKIPHPEVLGGVLLGHKAKLSVGFMDLWMTGLFPSQKALLAFIRYYRNFEFCKPTPITSYGKADDEMKMVNEMEKRVAKLLGKQLPKLKDYQTDMEGIERLRRMTSHSALSTGTSEVLGGLFPGRHMTQRGTVLSDESIGPVMPIGEHPGDEVEQLHLNGRTDKS